MSSSQGESDILSRINSAEFFKNIEQRLPEVTSYLEADSCSNAFGQVLQSLLTEGFKHLEIDSLQSLLLHKVLTITRKIFSDCLDSIRFNLETASPNTPLDTEYSLNQLLKVILDIMNGYSELLIELSSLESCIEADCLDSVPKILISVTSDTFQHCKQSEVAYGSFFGSCSANLTSLFRKSFEVQTCLLKVLDEKFSFTGQSEDDILLLLFVLEKLVEVSEIVCGFELNAIVDQWKGFVKLSSKYSECLRSRLDLTPSFTCLTSTLQTVLQTINSQKESWENGGWLTRQLKLGNFVLKVVIKLCELYSGQLSHRSHQLLLQLLINLHGLEEQYEDSEAGRLFRSYLSVGASPLLTHLLPDSTFIQEWRECCKENNLKGLKSSSRSGLYWLCVRINKKLLTSGQKEIQLIWINRDFIDSVINVISHCSEEVRDVAARSEDMESYPVLVASTAILMTSLLDVAAFQKVEKLLFYSLCSGNYFGRIFIQDLLCLLARLTSEAVVLCWVEWLETSMRELCSGQFDPLLVHLKCLRNRLTAFLSPKARKSRLSQTQSLSLLLNDLPPTPSIQHFDSLIKCLEGANLEESNCSDNLLILWQTVAETRPCRRSTSSCVSQPCSKSKLWWTHLLAALTKATSAALSCLEHVDFIVNIMVELMECPDSFVRLSVLECVRTILLNPVSSTNTTLSSTACQLVLSPLQDPQPVVRLASLQIIRELTKTEIHSEEIGKILQGQRNSSMVCDYLNGLSVGLKGFEESQDMYSQDFHRSDFIHRCSKGDETAFEIESEPPAKKVKVSNRTINEVMAKNKLIHKELKRCLEELGDKGLDISQKSILKDIISQYQAFSFYIGASDPEQLSN